MLPRRLRHASPLQDALRFLDVAKKILTQLSRRRTYMPSEEDMRLLETLCGEMHVLRIVIIRLEWHLERRLRGEAESPAPWDDGETG